MIASLRYQILLAVVVAVGMGNEPLTGQVIQLPSFETFTYSGSVLVPDRGTASIGGLNRSGSFRQSSGIGPFQNRTRGGFNSHSNLSVQATIIDLDQMDRELRGLSRSDSRDELAAHTEDHQQVVPPRPQSMVAEGKRLVRFARQQYELGEYETASYAYRLAIAKLDGHLLDYASAEFKERFGP